MKCFAGGALWRLGVGEFDQLSFCIAVKFDLVVTISLLAVNCIQSTFRVAFTDVVLCADASPDVLTGLFICEPEVSLQEDLRSVDVCRQPPAW